MKKFICVILMLLISLSLVACSNVKTNNLKNEIPTNFKYGTYISGYLSSTYMETYSAIGINNVQSYIEFKNNGTCIENIIESNEDNKHKFRFEDNKIKVDKLEFEYCDGKLIYNEGNKKVYYILKSEYDNFVSGKAIIKSIKGSNYSFFTKNAEIKRYITDAFEKLENNCTKEYKGDIYETDGFEIRFDNICFAVFKNNVIGFNNSQYYKINDKIFNYKKIKNIYNYCKSEISKDLSFPMPNLELKSQDNNYYEFYLTDKFSIDNYIKTLKNVGFSDIDQFDSHLLYKNNTIIEIEENEELYIKIYEGCDKVKENGLSTKDVKKLINNEDILYIIEKNVINLYEKTNMQIFYAIEKHYDDNMMVMDYKIYKYVTYKNNYIKVKNEYDDNFICCDIDGDKNYELAYLGYGNTSGVYSFSLNTIYIINNNISPNYNFFYPISWCNHKLVLLDNDKLGCFIMPDKNSSFNDEYKLNSCEIWKFEFDNNKLNLIDENGKRIKTSNGI